MDSKNWSKTRKWVYRSGCILAATTITVAALGGHKYDWSTHKKNLFFQAIKFGMFNSVGLIIAAFKGDNLLPAYLFAGSTLGFCGPIMYKCFTDSNVLSRFMPFGGILLIGAWIALAFA